MKTQFSFLASGPVFSLELPNDFSAVPYLSSPLLNGRGGRSFDFVPTEFDPGIGEAEDYVGTVTDKDGRSVEMWKRRDEPPLWWLRWILPSGVIHTHLREEDGVEFAETTASSLSIGETGSGTPVLLPDAPLEFGGSTAPGHQELATFVRPPRGAGWSVTLQRPGFVARGKTYVAPDRGPEGQYVARAGSKFGLELSITGDSLDEVRDLVASVDHSLSDS